MTERRRRRRWVPRLLGRYWYRLTDSMWFVPGAVVLGATLLAVLLVEIDSGLGVDLGDAWPRLFGVGAEGARGLLTAVATSMITVAGTAFSITLVALSLASSQYSSRVLRNFMRDRVNQAVLGLFVGIFAYCLVVLRTIRSGDDPVVPALSVVVALALGFIGVALLVFFIHHIATSIQASEIVASAARATGDTIDRMFPLPDGARRGPPVAASAEPALPVQPIASTGTGYLQRLDVRQLHEIADRHDVWLRVLPAIGDFVLEGDTVVELHARRPPNERMHRALRDCWVIGAQRTLEQDIDFGIRQLVDVGLKALSPSINDTTTAIMCVNYVTAALEHLSQRVLEYDDGNRHAAVRRVSVRGPMFADLLDTAYTQLRQHAGGNVAMLGRMLWSVERLGLRCAEPERRLLYLRHAERLRAAGLESIVLAADREAFDRSARAAVQRLAAR